MSLTRILVIFRKELRDTLRDRRTIVMMLVLPMILMPALIAGAAALAVRQVQQEQERPLRIAFVEEGQAPCLRAMIEARTDLRIVDDVPTDSLRSWVRSDSLDAAFIVDAEFESALAEMLPGRITLLFETDDSDLTARRLRD